MTSNIKEDERQQKITEDSQANNNSFQELRDGQKVQECGSVALQG